MTDTFSSDWTPLVGASATGTFRVRKTQFGDGYVQRSVDGPLASAHLQSWPLSWIGQPDGDGLNPLAIRDWLADHLGQTFYWTPPGGVQARYACEGYTLTAVDQYTFQLAATFVQDYRMEPV